MAISHVDLSIVITDQSCVTGSVSMEVETTTKLRVLAT